MVEADVHRMLTQQIRQLPIGRGLMGYASPEAKRCSPFQERPPLLDSLVTAPVSRLAPSILTLQTHAVRWVVFRSSWSSLFVVDIPDSRERPSLDRLGDSLHSDTIALLSTIFQAQGPRVHNLESIPKTTAMRGRLDFSRPLVPERVPLAPPAPDY